MEFAAERYDHMSYNRCGASGLQLPALSLGCWNNFDDDADADAMLALLSRAFDLGITHFDLANNYGPAPGAAEANVGRLLAEHFGAHRDELIISTKAGYDMWPGPYGDGGSKKYLVASLDQSLHRLGLDYVDIFYHHRPDPNTPMEESLDALDLVVRQGKALYAGVSNYKGGDTDRAQRHLHSRGLPLTVNQVSYNLLQRSIESDLLPYAGILGIGVVAFVPLAQGLLTDKYLDGIPADSRAARPEGTLQAERVTPQVVARVQRLGAIARERGQSMAQMALAWVLRDARITTALIGASRPEQIEENVAALAQAPFSPEELAAIDAALQD